MTTKQRMMHKAYMAAYEVLSYRSDVSSSASLIRRMPNSVDVVAGLGLIAQDRAYSADARKRARGILDVLIRA